MVRRLFLSSVLLAWAVPLIAAQKITPQVMTDLFAVIDQADEMVVYSEGFRRESVLYRSSNRKDFEALKSAISLKRGGGPFVCACVDGPEIALLKKNKEIAAVWNHEGTAIGSSVWGGDWDNTDPNRWLRWFDARGMKEPRSFFKQMHAERSKVDQDERRWLRAMPSSLKPLWPKTLKQYNPSINVDPDLKPLNLALQKQYPDRNDRIRALLTWFGSGAGPWSGYPAYEDIAEKLLRQFRTEDLIKIAEDSNLTDQQLEGAARIFGSWTPVPDPTPIPADLRRTLLEHSLKSGDEDKVQRAKRAFASDKQ